jgi:hypothetical protein
MTTRPADGRCSTVKPRERKSLDGRGAVPAAVLDRTQQQLVGDSRAAAVATADEEKGTSQTRSSSS